MKTALLFTESYDPTGDNLIQVLRHRGTSLLRWNLDSYPHASTLTYRASQEGFDGVLSVDSRVMPLSDIGSVWYRAVQARGFPESLNAQERDFAEHEAEHVVESLHAVSNWRWMNAPEAHRGATWKPAQLALARRLGLDIPRTLITNEPGAVNAFREECGGEIVYKTLSPSFLLEKRKTAFTGIVREENLGSLGLIRNAPGIFQELVPKDYEIRLTVVAEKMFAARILSQANDAARLDWRKAPYDVSYEAVELPTDVRAKVAAFLSQSGLVYSCLDLIVTPDGRHVFLESNPRGQYLWIEHYTGLPITDAIADWLTEEDN